MDKYEMNLKIEQIKQLAAKKSYKEAAAIAKEMSWHKVKDWNALATVINVQEAVGDYEEARDMAILAYNRNLGGRKLVYKLTEIMIKLKQFDDADGLYEEYERMSQHDVSRYILYYILKQKVRQITSLLKFLKTIRIMRLMKNTCMSLLVCMQRQEEKTSALKRVMNLHFYFRMAYMLKSQWN